MEKRSNSGGRMQILKQQQELTGFIMKQITTLSLLAAALYSSASFANLLITEVLYDAPNNDSTEEFVELYNNSCTAINLQGYSLQDNGGSFNLSGTVAPRSYFLIAKTVQLCKVCMAKHHNWLV